jgi:hypothetical protein
MSQLRKICKIEEHKFGLLLLEESITGDFHIEIDKLFHNRQFPWFPKIVRFATEENQADSDSEPTLCVKTATEQELEVLLKQNQVLV